MPGELYVGGACVGDGYVNDKELSAERFLPDPYGPGVMYKTGDLVKWATDGTIVFLGRDDTQVKLRGYRVECADVEAALLRHPDVRSCSVLADEGELFAFICADLGPDAESRLRAYLGGCCPATWSRPGSWPCPRFRSTPTGR